VEVGKYDSTTAQQVAKFYEAQQAAYLQPGSQVRQLTLESLPTYATWACARRGCVQ